MGKPIRKSRTPATGAPVQLHAVNKPTRHDWTTIRREFIEGIAIRDSQEREWMTLKEIAIRHNMSYGVLRKRAATERWSEQRAAAEYAATIERAKIRAKQIANNALDFDDKAHNIAKTGFALIHARLAELGQDMQAHKRTRSEALARKEQGLDVKKSDLYAAVRYTEINALAQAASTFQEIGMKALGTDVQKVDITGGEFAGADVTINVNTEMKRDDPERLAAMLGAMNQAGVLPDDVLKAISAAEDDDDEPFIEGEVIDAETDEQQEKSA